MSEVPRPDQSQFDVIADNLEEAVICETLDGIIETWNPSALRIFGYEAAEAIGRPITLILPPERANEEVQLLERLRNGEAIGQFHTVRITRAGARIPVALTLAPLKDSTGAIVGAMKIVRDLSRSAEVEGMFSAIVASTDDVIVSKDLNGIIKSWNAAAERIFGYTASEVIGQSINLIIPPERQDEEPRILQRIRSGERVDHFETVRRRKDGQLIEVSVTISPIKDPTGRIIGASKIARDITALKRFMREREQLLERERLARADAERISRMKDEFLATLSHELRTPLNAILGWSQLLRARPGQGISEEVVEGLDTIERNARAQTMLIEELLDMSRIISGKLRLDVQPVDLAGVVTMGVESFRPAAEAKGIRLHKMIDPAAGTVMGDANRLQQILWNLLSNALKFTPKGGRVQVLLQRVNSHVELTVSDTGQGIRRDFLPRLFTRFSQADASTTRQTGGLGLGLAIVRHLVELHGGMVKAMSAGEEMGSTFVVSLPLSPVYDDRQHEEASHPTVSRTMPLPPAAAVDTSLNLDGVKVLVVDDEADARNLVKRVLETYGAQVATADSARSALITLGKSKFDVLLSDIGMPGEDGFELLEKVRRLPASGGGKVPAVALTAFARSEDRQRALRAGFQMHVSKPVDAAELVTVIASVAGAIHPTGRA